MCKRAGDEPSIYAETLELASAHGELIAPSTSQCGLFALWRERRQLSLLTIPRSVVTPALARSRSWA